MIDLSKVKTEKVNPNTSNFSSMSIREALEIMNEEDLKSVECIKEQFDNIERLISKTSDVLRSGGRIIYAGAGTSGRLGVLDAVECPPTFGVDYNTVVGLIAGGDNAFVKAKEGAEDSKEEGKKDLEKINFSQKDILIGVAASGRTPYVIGAIEYAKSIGASTGSIACTTESEIGRISDYPVEVVPGPEVLTGSTRLKAGTSTKLVLNMISTISMKNLGKVYKNYMVDLKLSNKKLSTRAINILTEVTGCSVEEAEEKLKETDGHVKLAIVMILFNLNKEDALNRLNESDGHIDKINM
ncbi:N-acetylmuramic acid 6-phosphate etherase [uncultured Helcococcus sp.]|uniref:N-acetylmuramic acid 6-phosphate etherase n=1 Tax=uncultured Helcococcus sp. TaxID=1072508 RepID=UPI002889D150|nr:N-acetylmuramic acid 6-phosphate etherase [uncultured Helcococcus sp.]